LTLALEGVHSHIEHSPYVTNHFSIKSKTMVIRRLSAVIKVWRTIFSTSEGTAGERAISRTKKGLKVRVLRDRGDVNNYIVDNITVRESVCETFCLHRLRFLHGCNIDLADFTFGCVKTIRVHAFHPRAARGISQASSAQRTHIACRLFYTRKTSGKGRAAMLTSIQKTAS